MSGNAIAGRLGPLLLVGCSAANASHSLSVGSDGSGGSNGGPRGVGSGGLFTASDAGVATSNPLSAHIESPPGMTVTFVTLSCSNRCADVLVVAKGGFAPYTFAWTDGSTAQSRTVCPTSTTNYQVTVTDSGSTSGEFEHPAESVTATLTADVVACSNDAGVSRMDAGACSPDAASVLPETLALDVTGSVRYFANGASLPRGRYRVEYVDGCMMYGPATMYGGVPGWGWDIHAGSVLLNFWLSGFPDAGYCVLVGSSASNIVTVLPGTTNGAPGYATYADCVDANRSMDTPTDFDFSGGQLGMVVKDGLASDDVGGESQGGVSPTWKLSLLEACP